MKRLLPRSLLSLLCLLPLACGEADQRAFAVENALFASWYLEENLPAGELTVDRRGLVAAGLAAICRGDTGGTADLLRTAGIGPEIYRLALIAAKADRKGRCDYSDWPEKRGLHGERIKQLVNQGDAPAVLLAALLDAQLPAAERLRVVAALAERRYGQAQAVLAALHARQGDNAPELLAQAQQQAVALAYVLQAATASGAAACPHRQQARQLVPGLRLPAVPACA